MQLTNMTHMDNEGSGAPASESYEAAGNQQPPALERLIIHVCVIFLKFFLIEEM